MLLCKSKAEISVRLNDTGISNTMLNLHNAPLHNNIQPKANNPCGILVDNKLKFHEQCSAVVAKANRFLGVIRRSFDCTNAEMILRLYKSLIRPVIEYGNIIWGPFYVSHGPTSY